MSIVADFLTRVARAVTAYAGDETLMQAAVSAAANVIVADGEVAGEEFETALKGVLASPILEKGYDALMLEEALYDAIGRARTRADGPTIFAVSRPLLAGRPTNVKACSWSPPMLRTMMALPR